MHTLMIINPGHFHAGLILRERHPAISRDVYIYSEAGPDLENFMNLASAFNQRAEHPTDWVFHIYADKDYLNRAIAERKGDVAILAGRNDRKIYDIEALHNAGFKILSDKPLTIDDAGVAVLRKILATDPVLMDIMTERHEMTTLLQRELFRNKAIFGTLRCDGDKPAIEKESVHHLCKLVNGTPLVRPAWYLDVNVQGEGIVDVTTHLVDIVQWMVFGDESLDFDRDVRILDARTWDTAVPLAKYCEVTRRDGFPPELADRVKDGVLALRSNGEFTYTLRGVPVRISVVWALEAEPGGGDTQRSVMRGTGAELLIEQGPATGGRAELFVVPADGDCDRLAPKLEQALRESRFQGLKAVREGDRFRIDIPAALRTTHEMHFAAVRDEFLAMVDGGAEPANSRANLLTKYATLAAARDAARR